MNLRLKHHFDTNVVLVDPRSVEFSIKVGTWRALEASNSKWGRLKSWIAVGDGLKNVMTHFSRNLHGHFIAEGAWDVRRRPFEPLPVIRQLFVEGLDPADTDEYRRYLQNIETGRLAWTRGMRSRADLDAYFTQMMEAFEDIRDNGYRTQREMGVPGGADEIRVCVSHKGDLCIYGGGTHRLSMALALDLEEVPVVVKRIHSKSLRGPVPHDFATAVERVTEVVTATDSGRGGGQ